MLSPFRPRRGVAILLAVALAAIASSAVLVSWRSGRGAAFPDPDVLLPAIRREAFALPGELPAEVRVLPFYHTRWDAAILIDGAKDDTIEVVHAVFQVRYARGWIMVDAGHDRAMVTDTANFSDEAYDRVQRALRAARIVVVTHEHWDHVAGIVRSEYRTQLEHNTILTRAQVRGLLDQPRSSLIRMDSLQAQRFQVVDYDPILPIAPGVVLIKAAGHTPGSQMVYVRLATGREFILVGDVSWMLSGVENERQKPSAVSQTLGEDRAAIGRQLTWLRHVAGQGVTVVVAHDANGLATLVKRGLLQQDVDLRNP